MPQIGTVTKLLALPLKAYVSFKSYLMKINPLLCLMGMYLHQLICLPLSDNRQRLEVSLQFYLRVRLVWKK